MKFGSVTKKLAEYARGILTSRLKKVPSLSVAAFVCFFWDFVHSSYIEYAAGRRLDFLVLRDLLIFSQVSSTYLECITSFETPLKTFGKYSFLVTSLPVNIRCIEYNEIIMSQRYN